MTDWLVWQWLDSAFPAGALAHSGGLEAAWRAGHVRDADGLQDFLTVSLHQAARLAVPFVTAACRLPDAAAMLDERYDLLLSSAIANRASRAQGQAMLASAARIFAQPLLSAARSSFRRRGAPTHLPIACGLVAAALGVDPAAAAHIHLFVTLRTGISAAVRLGIIGPLQGQSMQQDLAPLGQRLAAEAATLSVDEAAQTAPVAELLQGMSDRLYSRLFIS